MLVSNKNWNDYWNDAYECVARNINDFDKPTQMITCAKCPTQVLPDWHFCPACGELLAQTTSDATTGIKFISAPTQDQVIQSEGFAKTSSIEIP